MPKSKSGSSATPQKAAETAYLYTEQYFQGGQTKSNYSNYVEQSLGPSRILGDTIHKFFRPSTALDVGCAVGHAVKRLRELGTEAYGYDISEWAVNYANAPFIRQFDFSKNSLKGGFDLVFSYDVIEHVVPERLEFAAKNLWQATSKDLLLVPAIYENGETSDPNEPTHMIFQGRQWWIDYFVNVIGCWYDEEATARFQKESHSKIFDYTHRIMVFSKLKPDNTECGM